MLAMLVLDIFCFLSSDRRRIVILWFLDGDNNLELMSRNRNYPILFERFVYMVRRKCHCFSISRLLLVTGVWGTNFLDLSQLE